jgi:hypothetical protein
MLRSLLRPVVAVLVFSAATPVWASDDTTPAAPAPVVTAGWATEPAQQAPSAKPINLMLVSYAALQGLDMASTIQARRAGAREANPVLAGGFGQAAAMKAALALSAIGAVKLMGKKNRKAALFTAIALNVAGAVVVANNMKNTHHLAQ